jgi:predicted secreted protein
VRYLGQGLLAVTLGLIIAQLFLPDQGVGFVTGFVVFLLMWWMVFFTTLPLGVQSQIDAGDVVEGSEPGAPEFANIGAKMWLTTQIACGFWLVFFVCVEFGLVSLDMLSLGPDLQPTE